MLCLSVLLVVMDNTIVNVALPTMSRELAASTQSLQWVVDAYTLVFAGLLLVGGNLGDRLGRRRMLQAGLVLFALTSVGAALSRTTGELIAGRAAMGVAAALIYPATLALLTTSVHPRPRAGHRHRHLVGRVRPGRGHRAGLRRPAAASTSPGARSSTSTCRS